MTIYTVHAPAAADRSIEAADRIRFVPEGFSWPAFLIAPVWLLWHRLWLPLVGYMVALGLIQAGDVVLPAGLLVVIGTAFSFWFALEANAMRRWVLERRGLAMVAVVESTDRETAERRFFEAWLAPSPVAETPDPAGAGPRPASVPHKPGPTGVIGLFPSAGGR